MGVSKHVNSDLFPEQGAFLGRKVKVCFNYDTDKCQYL